jgi:NAD(P)-dependent dehydrogenase (short-subunit alcohol dehydrogenase family)
MDIAFLGLGRMGTPMAANLARAGHRLTVWNRTPEKAERFAAEHGARAARSPALAVADADVVVTMLADDRALLDAYMGEAGALPAIRRGRSPSTWRPCRPRPSPNCVACSSSGGSISSTRRYRGASRPQPRRP